MTTFVRQGLVEGLEGEVRVLGVVEACDDVAGLDYGTIQNPDLYFTILILYHMYCTELFFNVLTLCTTVLLYCT